MCDFGGMMWSVIKWKRWDLKKERWDVFYNSVPESWIRGSDCGKPILLWPTATKATIEKLRKSGSSYAGNTEEIHCKVLAKNIADFTEATATEIRLFEEEKSNEEITSDMEDSDVSEVVTRHQAHKQEADFNKMFKTLVANDGQLNKQDIQNPTDAGNTEISKSSSSDLGKDSTIQAESSSHENGGKSTQIVFDSNYDSNSANGQVVSDIPLTISCENCK